MIQIKRLEKKLISLKIAIEHTKIKLLMKIISARKWIIYNL